MENVAGPAVVISNEKNSQTQINMENIIVMACPCSRSMMRARLSGRRGRQALRSQDILVWT